MSNGERRLALLRDLAARNATARTAHDACVVTMDTLAGQPDVAFALAYLDDELQATTPGAERILADTRPDLVKTFSVASSTGGRAAIVEIDRAQPIAPGAVATVPKQVTGLPTELAARRAVAAIVAVP